MFGVEYERAWGKRKDREDYTKKRDPTGNCLFKFSLLNPDKRKREDRRKNAGKISSFGLLDILYFKGLLRSILICTCGVGSLKPIFKLIPHHNITCQEIQVPRKPKNLGL